MSRYDERWQATDVACPECGAARGEVCRGEAHGVREDAARAWIPPREERAHTCPQSDPGPEDVTEEAACRACHPPTPIQAHGGPYRTAGRTQDD